MQNTLRDTHTKFGSNRSGSFGGEKFKEITLKQGKCRKWTITPTWLKRLKRTFYQRSRHAEHFYQSQNLAELNSLGDIYEKFLS